MPAEVELKAEGINGLLKAIRAEEDGKALRKDLAKNMREALAPAAEAAKSGIMSMPALGGGAGAKPALRASIAKRIRPEVKLGGKWTGARVKARKIPGVRSFANAPKRTQQARGWQRRVWGTDRWVTQQGKVDWFDKEMREIRGDARGGVQKALNDMADRIAKRAR